MPAGEVSVMPQPPPSRSPVIPSIRTPTSCGRAAPPELVTFRLDRSRRVISGWLAMAIHMVGTP